MPSDDLSIEELENRIGQLEDELAETRKDRIELKKLREEIVEMRALIHSLAAAAKYGEAIFLRDPTAGEQDRSNFSDGLAEVYGKTNPR